jgi:hypothetical protein
MTQSKIREKKTKTTKQNIQFVIVEDNDSRTFTDICDHVSIDKALIIKN